MEDNWKTIQGYVNAHLNRDDSGSVWFSEYGDEEGSTISMKYAIQILLKLLAFLGINHSIQISDNPDSDDLLNLLLLGFRFSNKPSCNNYTFPSPKSYYYDNCTPAHVYVCFDSVNTDEPEMTIFFPNLDMATEFYSYLN